MATEKKDVHPVTKKDVKKKDKAKAPTSRKARKFEPKKTAIAIGHFFRDVFFELKKVTWPTRKEFVSYSIAVVVFVVIFGAIIYAMDQLLLLGLRFIA